MDGLAPPPGVPTGSPEAPTPAPAGRAGPHPLDAGRRLYLLFLRLLVTRGRVVSLLLLGAGALLIAWAIAASVHGGGLRSSVRLVAEYGFRLFLPVSCLVFASSAFGDLRDDQTLVYLWLRPVRRGVTVAAAYLAVFSVTLPLVVLPLIAAAAIAGGRADGTIGTAVATTIGMITYDALFLAIGLRFRRSLMWGLLYVFIWEGAVSGVSETAAKLAVLGYNQSMLRNATGVRLELGLIDSPWAWLVPLLASAAALAYSWRTLRRQDVP